jgi:Tfp pilus assembly protein PilO
MIANLARRERLLLVLCLSVAVAVAGWELVVQPVRARNQVAADLWPAREQMLARHQELIARKNAITRELANVDAKIDTLSARLLMAVTIHGASPPVAASELQKIAKEMAAAAAMEVRSERILPPVERGELLEIPVEITVSGELRNLVDLLTRLEGAPKLVTVQGLKIRVMNIAQPKELLATITLSGYIIASKTRT